MHLIWELHLLNFVHRLKLQGEPSYLSPKMLNLSNLHPVNVRSVCNLNMSRYFTSTFRRSFTYNCVKKYNQIINELKKLSCAAFKQTKTVLYAVIFDSMSDSDSLRNMWVDFENRCFFLL